MTGTFKQVVHYFAVYQKYLGKRMYLVFVLMFLATLAESVGIMMLLPLIMAVDSEIGKKVIGDSDVAEALQTFLEITGIGNSALGILLFIAVIFLLKGLILFSSSAYESCLTASLMQEMKSDMFRKFMNMDYLYYSSHNTGHFINIINQQITGLINSFKNYKLFLATVISTVVYISTAFFVSWEFAGMSVVAGVILLFSFRRLNSYVHRISKENSHLYGSLYRSLVQAIHAYKYLAATAQMKEISREVNDTIKELSNYTRTKALAQGLTMALTEPISILFILLVIIVQIVVLDGAIGPVFVSLILFNRALLGIMGIQGTWQSTLSKIGSLELVEEEFLNLEQNQEVSGKCPMGRLEKGIWLEGVSFAYSEKTGDVLKDISLHIPAKSTVAFVGESGAGKSTLIDMFSLLIRPRLGRVLIDQVDGVDLDLASWRRQIGYVSQETVIFDDTVANNISLWKTDYASGPEARREIEHAAEQAFADRFIERLPWKYETKVGDRGVRLSGGQRQRLFLARELYKKPRLLILDEATSALDSESEKFIQESIESLKGRMTVVIIAHRLSTIQHADMIVVLKDGRVHQCGTYEELMEKSGGDFARMVELQSL